jgi:hypothetical protein
VDSPLYRDKLIGRSRLGSLELGEVSMDRWLAALMAVFLCGCAPDEPRLQVSPLAKTGPAAGDNSKDFEPFSIRSPDGVLIGLADIEAYDWNTHTITLVPGKKQELDEIIGLVACHI